MKRLLILMLLALCSSLFAQRKVTTNEAVKFAVGPFFDSTDGITPETGITVTALTVEIYREFDADSLPTRFANFVPTTSGGGANDMVLIGSSVSGMYSLEVTAAQLNFTGPMILTIVDTDSAGIEGLPYWRPFLLTSANVVDAEYGTDKLQVDQVELGSSTQSTTDLKDFADTGYDPATNKVEGVKLTDTTTTLTGHTNQTGDTYALANNGTYGLAAIEALVDELESRLTALRAGYLDELGSTNLPSDIDGIKAKTDNLPTDPADASAVAGLIGTAQSDLDTITGADGATLATSQGLYAPAKAGDLMGLSDDALTAAKITDAAWQELIELLFTYDATATYATADAGSVVKQIAGNATATIPPRIE